MYEIDHLIDVAGIFAGHFAEVFVDLERLHEADLSGFNQSIGCFIREKKSQFYHTLSDVFTFAGFPGAPPEGKRACCAGLAILKKRLRLNHIFIYFQT